MINILLFVGLNAKIKKRVLNIFKQKNIHAFTIYTLFHEIHVITATYQTPIFSNDTKLY